MLYIGYVLSVLGLLFLALGLIGAAFTVFPKIRGQGVASGLETIASILKALPAVIKELAAAPPWISSSIIGIALIAGGQYIVVKGSPGGSSAVGERAESPKAS